MGHLRNFRPTFIWCTESRNFLGPAPWFWMA